jgi:hypothetical protein
MASLTTALLSGLAFGAFSAAIMLPMKFPDKTAALAGAFINRFGTGFLIPLVALPMPGWAAGLFIGVLLSLPSAIITKAYPPIMGIGAIGGAIIGALTRGSP